MPLWGSQRELSSWGTVPSVWRAFVQMRLLAAIIRDNSRGGRHVKRRYTFFRKSSILSQQSETLGSRSWHRRRSSPPWLFMKVPGPTSLYFPRKRWEVSGDVGTKRRKRTLWSRRGLNQNGVPMWRTVQGWQLVSLYARKSPISIFFWHFQDIAESISTLSWNRGHELIFAAFNLCDNKCWHTTLGEKMSPTWHLT